MGCEFGVSKCKLLHIGWINSKVLLYGTENYTQYPVITHHERECVWKNMKKNVYYVYIDRYNWIALLYSRNINTTLSINYISIKQFTFKTIYNLKQKTFYIKNYNFSSVILKGVWKKGGVWLLGPGLWQALSCHFITFLSCFFLLLLFLPHCTVCRILVPRPGIEPRPQKWKCQVLTTELPENSHNFLFGN